MSGKNDAIQIPAIFTGFSSRADGGASIRFATQELNDVDFGALKKLHNTFGWILFRANEFKPEDIPKEDAPDEGKSQAQRLRGVLFVLWTQQGSKGNFDTFYRDRMERAINRVKDLLD